MTDPLRCRPEARELFADACRQLHTTRGLVRGGVAISLHAEPDTSAVAVERTLQDYADTVRRRLRSDDPRAVVAHLHGVLFDEGGLEGNAEDYYDPRNSYLPAVLETKRGIPITLSLVYKAVAARLGLAVEGVNAPGHFLAELRTGSERMLVDPFHHGRILTRQEAFERIAAVMGTPIPATDALLPIATHRDWLARLLQNLINILGQGDDADTLAAMLELRALLEQ